MNSILRISVRIILLVFPLLTGCGGLIVLNETTPPVSSTSAAQYHAYGDSITFGETLKDPLAQSYPALTAEFEKVTFANNALEGDQSCDVAARQIFPNGDSPTLSAHPTYSLLIGTDDANGEGTGAYESVFMVCHRAVISWFAIPKEYKSLATGSGVTSTGPGELDTANQWGAWTTGGFGATVSFAITTSTAGPIYAWPIVDDSSPATFTYALDGSVLGSSSAKTTPEIATHNGTTRSLGFLRLAQVPPGPHIVTFTQTNQGANGMSIVGIGTPAGTTSGKLPIVLAGTIPFQLHGSSGSGCTVSDAPCLEYNKDIEADVAEFAGDGLDVRLFDTRKYMFGTQAEMNDAYHPNALGQREISHAVEAAW